MKGWKDNKSIDNLFHRLGNLESTKVIQRNESAVDNTNAGVPYATAEELEQMTAHEYYEARFNWRVKEILPHYKLEIMRVYNITSDEEYSRRVLEGDESIYLPQPNPKFEGTWYDERVAHVLGLSYQELQDKFDKGELEHKRGGYAVIDPKTGRPWCDENPVVF